MKTSIPSLALLLVTFATATACELSIEGPGDGLAGSDTEEASETDDGDDSSGPSLTTAGDDPDEPSADGSSGGSEPSSACEAYCQVELACDEFYETNVECVEACERDRSDSAACGPAYDATNACLATLDCDAFFDFWIAMSMLESGEDPGEFPCAAALYDYVVCLSDEDGGTGGT